MRAMFLLPALLLAATTADAARVCSNETPIRATLDFAGIERVDIDLGPHELHLTGVPGGGGEVSGRACASDKARLPTLEIERTGTTLRLRASRAEQRIVLFGSDRGEWLSLTVSLPQAMPVSLGVGSGDARVEDVAALVLSIGSGDVNIPRLRGPLEVSVGSGDLVARDIGPLQVRSLGSGDITVDHVRGDATIGSVGSGDITLRRVDGSASIDSIGSGDVELHAVAGDVTLQRIGSGDLVVRDTGGDLTVHRKGSGDIRHSGVAGRVTVPGRR
jgi:hypothetical protein